MSQTPKLGNSVLWLNSKKPTKIGLSRQRPSTDRKTNFKIQIDHLQPYSTNRANLAKIGPVDVEIIGLAEIVKMH